MTGTIYKKAGDLQAGDRIVGLTPDMAIAVTYEVTGVKVYDTTATRDVTVPDVDKPAAKRVTRVEATARSVRDSSEHTLRWNAHQSVLVAAD